MNIFPGILKWCFFQQIEQSRIYRNKNRMKKVGTAGKKFFQDGNY
jgi:hypothetical protein